MTATSVAAGPAVRHDPGSADLAAIFSESCRRHAGLPALLDGGRELSYHELGERVAAVSRRLVDLGVAPGDAVYVCAARGLGEVLAVLGALSVGATYVALRPDVPDVVLAHQAGTVGGGILLHDGADRHLDLLARLQGVCPSLGHGVDVLRDRVAYLGGRLDGRSKRDSAVVPPGERTAYVGFTSGSTGAPKAARIPHRAVARLAAPGGQEDVACGPGSSMLRLAPLAFDASTLEIFLPLLNGGRLVVGPADPVSVSSLRSVLSSGSVSHLWLTAGLMRVMAERAPDSFAAVRHLLTGGDVVPAPAVRRLLECHPGLRVTNGYGPTENTTFTTMAHLDRLEDCVDPLPIGYPVAGGGVAVLGPDRRPVARGQVGEIAAWGLGLAHDYQGSPEATTDRFVSLEELGRVYLTGDLGHLDEQGCLHFHGRCDGQVKVRGHRVETEGVRQALLAMTGVLDAVVFAEPGTDAASRRLVAAVVPETGTSVTAHDLRTKLEGRLSPAEVPQLWCVVPTLPLTRNHKVDLDELRRLALALRPRRKVESSVVPASDRETR